MTDYEMLPFCSPDDIRGLRMPFVRSKWKYATNAKLIIRVPSDEPDRQGDHGKAPDAAALYTGFPEDGFEPLDKSGESGITSVKGEAVCLKCLGRGRYGQAPCQMCYGAGCAVCRDTCETWGKRCPRCDGSETVAPNPEDGAYIVKVRGLSFDSRLVALMLSLSGLLIRAAESLKDRLWFTFAEGGQGIVMARAEDADK